ncbi:MAG: plastocyanin/azurin family copper-binding protein, partial [Acidimicrobiales bacterium]
IVAGTEIVWVNRGRNDHNIIPEDRDPQWLVEDVDFEPGDEASFVFDTPGSYLYYCSIHGNLTAGMPGVIVVTAP